MSTWPALEDPLESTRVFELLPASAESEEIELKLHVVSISSTSTNNSAAVGSFSSTPSKYEAISYTWAGQAADRRISLDGHVYMIRKNLWHCLRRFRRQDRSRMLWADSISINQDDKVEKGYQVSVIGKIFRRATRVLAWIGEDKEEGEEDAVMEDVSKTTVRPGSVVPYGGCARLLKIAATTPPQDQPSRQTRWVRGMLSRLRGKSLTSTLNMVAYDPRRKNYEALVREWSCLARRTFWTRRWIIQELVLARDLVICCGDAQVGWDAFIKWFTYVSGYLWDSSVTES